MRIFSKDWRLKKEVIPSQKEKQICQVCEEYVRLHRELDFILVIYKVIKYHCQSYGCPSCKEGQTRTIRESANLKVSGSGSSGKSPCLGIHPCMSHVSEIHQWASLYRQEKDRKRYGAQISRTTPGNWIIYCTQNYFQQMYNYFHREMMKYSFAMADGLESRYWKRRSEAQV